MATIRQSPVGVRHAGGERDLRTIFRIIGRLLEKGNELVRPLGIASAQWQAVGAVSLAGNPLSAPQIAEAMGVTRQRVRKQLNRMQKDNLFEKLPGLRHERASLYRPTAKGGTGLFRGHSRG